MITANFEQVLKTFGTDPMIQGPLEEALILHKSGHTEEAERLYRKILSVHPKNADALHLLGILLGQQSRFEEALTPLKTALALELNSSSFHNSMGNVQKHLGHIDQAIHHYQLALKSPSASSAVHNNLGTLYHLKNDWAQAIKYYKQAIAIREDYADAHYNLANTLTASGLYDQAISELHLTLKHQPDHVPAHFHLAQLLLHQNKAAEAIPLCEYCIEKDPYHIEAHHQLSVALTQLNRLDEAIIFYEKTLVLNPSHVEALHNLGALYVIQRNPTLALPCYLKLLDIQKDFDAYYNIGVIYLYQDRHEDAIHYLKEALNIEPNAFNVYVNLGATYLKKEIFDEAIIYYEKALSLKPEDPELIYLLTALSGKMHDLKTAPTAYVEHLFDQYAPYFDQHLTKHLNYQVPALLLSAMKKVCGPHLQIHQLLDLGCGTGLCGAAFKPYTQKLIGIDLSEGMLEAARKKQIYDLLVRIDLEKALATYAESDLILAGDVFGYIGDLEALFSNLKKSLSTQGFFAFTTEKNWKNHTYVLQNNARFAHHPEYIENLAKKYQFEILLNQTVILRDQKEKPVEGMLWVVK